MLASAADREGAFLRKAQAGESEQSAEAAAAEERAEQRLDDGIEDDELRDHHADVAQRPRWRIP
jgi:hypothetical protein